MNKLICAMAAVAVITLPMAACSNEDNADSGTEGNAGKTQNLRLMYWNIQNGMWADQGSDYNNFVEYVKSKDPDICVWCEAASIYETGTNTSLAADAKYLPNNWSELAARYGHKYTFLGGFRDNYPQVITSKYPIDSIARIVGTTDTVVSHGAGMARISVNGQTINVVTLHTWPQKYGYGVATAQRDADAKNNGGDRYRRKEIEYLCHHTIDTDANASKQYWMMMGDFNSVSRVDNDYYKLASDTTAFLCQDYIINNTPYLDIIHEKYPSQFISTIYAKRRIDYVFCTQPLYDCITDAAVIRDNYTSPVRDALISNLFYPSDHCPILVDFAIPKAE
jgi:hypothetical protein